MLKSSDIVLIPFPFSDLSHQKRRPVLLFTAPDTFGDFLASSQQWLPPRQGMTMPFCYKTMIL